MPLSAANITRTELAWTAIAKEPINIEASGCVLYGFGSELSVLRLLHAHRLEPMHRLHVGRAPGRNDWYFAKQLTVEDFDK